MTSLKVCQIVRKIANDLSRSMPQFWPNNSEGIANERWARYHSHAVPFSEYEIAIKAIAVKARTSPSISLLFARQERRNVFLEYTVERFENTVSISLCTCTRNSLPRGKIIYLLNEKFVPWLLIIHIWISPEIAKHYQRFTDSNNFSLWQETVELI